MFTYVVQLCEGDLLIEYALLIEERKMWRLVLIDHLCSAIFMSGALHWPASPIALEYRKSPGCMLEQRRAKLFRRR